jgi:uncharacterized protein YbaP (TraB family)
MTKLFLFFAFIFIGKALVIAQEQHAVTDFPMKESSLLWKIEGPGIPKGSYLFGTMHLIEKKYFVFPDKLEKLVKKSDQLVMELPGLPNQLEALKLVNSLTISLLSKQILFSAGQNLN